MLQSIVSVAVDSRFDSNSDWIATLIGQEQFLDRNTDWTTTLNRLQQCRMTALWRASSLFRNAHIYWRVWISYNVQFNNIESWSMNVYNLTPIPMTNSNISQLAMHFIAQCMYQHTGIAQ